MISPRRQAFHLRHQRRRALRCISRRHGLNQVRQASHPRWRERLCRLPNLVFSSGDRLLLSHESSVEPADFWVYDLTSRKPRQLTYSVIASLNAAPRPPSQIVSYKSFDGKTISALLWVPFNLKRDASNPALVLPHGGPPDNPGLLEPAHRCVRLPRLHLHRAQRARFDRLRHRFSKSQLQRPGRRQICRTRFTQPNSSKPLVT